MLLGGDLDERTQFNDSYKYSKGGVFGRVRSIVYRRYFLGKYPTEVFGKVRHGLSTLQSTPVRLGMYEVDTGTWHFGMFDTPTKNTPAMYRYTIPNTPLLRNIYRRKFPRSERYRITRVILL